MITRDHHELRNYPAYIHSEQLRRLQGRADSNELRLILDSHFSVFSDSPVSDPQPHALKGLKSTTRAFGLCYSEPARRATATLNRVTRRHRWLLPFDYDWLADKRSPRTHGVMQIGFEKGISVWKCPTSVRRQKESEHPRALIFLPPGGLPPSRRLLLFSIHAHRPRPHLIGWNGMEARSIKARPPEPETEFIRKLQDCDRALCCSSRAAWLLTTDEFSAT